MARPEVDRPTDLTPRERLAAGYLHIIGGVDQHIIAAAFGVNPGRVSEAITAMRLVLEDPKRVRAAAEDTQ